MIEIIPISDSVRWDDIVKNFKNPDVYYLSGYVKAFEINGDGSPVLMYYHDGETRAICVMMIRDVSVDPLFIDVNLPKDTYFDLVTPYGYGGFYFEGNQVSSDTIKRFNIELKNLLLENKFISAFFRFHPLLKNSLNHQDIVQIVDLGKTIAIDLTSPEIIWQNITSKNRNMIRKAQKSRVVIKSGTDAGLFKEFKEIYDETMRHDNAQKYYFFDEDFYESISKDLKDNYRIFYAEFQGEIIAMSIMIFSGSSMHYHLSGSKFEYRFLAPSNLLLYEAALWGHTNGFKTFHLGGGVGSGEDNLYKFKSAFNRNSDYQFSIGKMIIDETQYSELLSYRGFSDENLAKISFFPAYRANI